MSDVKKILFVFFVSFTCTNAQNYFVSVEFGISKYDSPKAEERYMYNITVMKRMSLYNEYLYFSTGIGLSHYELLLKDVTILPVLSGNPGKFYNNDIFFKLNYLEIPLILENSISLSKGFAFNIFLELH